jgi:1,4-alpha-glucan branching enzyme
MMEGKSNTGRTRKPSAKKVTFSVALEGAREVVLTGDFTGWKEEGIKLSKSSAGEWRTTLELVPGEYQYRLRVDGHWKDNPSAKKRVPNPYGSENCVLQVE